MRDEHLRVFSHKSNKLRLWAAYQLLRWTCCNFIFELEANSSDLFRTSIAHVVKLQWALSYIQWNGNKHHISKRVCNKKKWRTNITWDNKRKERTILRSPESQATRPAAVRPCGLKNGKVGYHVSCVWRAGKVSHRSSEIGLNKHVWVVTDSWWNWMRVDGVIWTRKPSCEHNTALYKLD